MTTKRKYIKDVFITEERPAENIIMVSQRTMASTFVRKAIWLLSHRTEGNKGKIVHDTIEF